MKQIYLKCLKKLREFRKTIKNDKDKKKGKLYFSWLVEKTDKIEKENDDNYIYNNILKYTLGNYKIDKYNYERLNDKLKEIVNNNYSLIKNNYVFSNTNISKEDTLLLAKKVIFKRGNVVWIDFGFNIGNEFGGMHPAIIIKTFDKELFVLPVSSKKPKEYIKIDKEYEDGKITLEECREKKDNVSSVIQLDNIYRFRNMVRWADITRMRKVSWLRLNFSGTIGKIDGQYITKISEKISKEFYV